MQSDRFDVAPRRLRSYASWGAAACVLAVGCGETPTAQVSGRAEFIDGSPLTGAVRTVTLSPTEDSTAKVRKAAQATIESDGSFKLYTRKPGDGVFKGDYAVVFTVLKDPNLGGMLVPDMYGAKESTPFRVTIDADRSDLLYQLEKR